MTNNQFYGWFDDASPLEGKPTYDPPHDAPCLFCGGNITADDVRTHSIMYEGNDYAKRSYFYRTHRTCAIKAGRSAERMADEMIFAMITRNGD